MLEWVKFGYASKLIIISGSLYAWPHIPDPRLIIVDEPTAGLDPEERVRFHNLLSAIGENVIVILSTHIVADVSDLCRQMAIIHQGRGLLTGDPAELVLLLKGRVWKKFIDESDSRRIASAIR